MDGFDLFMGFVDNEANVEYHQPYLLINMSLLIRIYRTSWWLSSSYHVTYEHSFK